MATKTQLNKVERLARKIVDNYNKLLILEEKSEWIRTSKENLEIDRRHKIEENLNKELESYCKEINLTYNEFYSIQVLTDLYCGITYEEFTKL